MTWFERFKNWWQTRLHNGRIQSMMWHEDIARGGQRVIFGAEKKKRKPKSQRGIQ